MAYFGAKIIVHQGDITKFILPGGEVSEAVHQVAKNGRTYAKAFAPKRSGKLAANIYAGAPITRGINTMSSSVAANVRYASHVNYGTSGPITAGGKWMRLAPGGKAGGRKYGKLFKKKVAGQKGQLFLDRGVATAMDQFRRGG